eukprot:356925-Chlamydomonas_euryale.AAC.5
MPLTSPLVTQPSGSQDIWDTASFTGSRLPPVCRVKLLTASPLSLACPPPSQHPPLAEDLCPSGLRTERAFSAAGAQLMPRVCVTPTVRGFCGCCAAAWP